MLELYLSTFADTVLGQIIDWIYGQIIGFLGDFFMQMGNMGADLFTMSWVQSVVLFFSYLAWALYGVGLVVAAFECGIEYQSGRGSIKDTALNAIKGFMSVGLFTTVPVELYKLSVSLQGSFTAGIVSHIVVTEQDRLQFHLLGGFAFTEQLPKEVFGR